MENLNLNSGEQVKAEKVNIETINGLHLNMAVERLKWLEITPENKTIKIPMNSYHDLNLTNQIIVEAIRYLSLSIDNFADHERDNINVVIGELAGLAKKFCFQGSDEWLDVIVGLGWNHKKRENDEQ